MFPGAHSDKHFCESIPVSAWEDTRLSTHHSSYLTLFWKFQPKQDRRKLRHTAIRWEEAKLPFKEDMTIYIENVRESLKKNLLESGSNKWRVSNITVHKKNTR